MSKCVHHHGEFKELCVQKVPIFNHLDREEMIQVVNLSTPLHYKKGELIFQDGESLDYLYIIHVGAVKIYRLYSNGKEQLLRVLHPGDFMGDLALFTKKEIDSYAEALEDTEICAIHRNDMQQLMLSKPIIATKILEKLSVRLEETEKLVGQLSVHDAEARIASYLLDLKKSSNSSVVSLPMSKKDLASFLGTTRETISRRLSHFQTQGWIEQKGHRGITLKDLSALQKIAQEE
ncbi:Crp/Fnr family transcriptional regulator [Virgibacillus soli]|uniref:Crp/Fnr family transcriptional regulator n=1 Tax=Paracerasibacillus soli TaxID=480284 RepID=A0ABU5CSI3_9BACI|nr:Crp/Fnr family transcriptional regulator [Virgibacillus soli]MDY0408779.1 Crp/Fnr family transcriptional regulator [Virgibacillus soli]